MVLISEIIVDIQVLLREFTLLLVAKDQIDAFVEIIRYLLRFQHDPHLGGEQIGVMGTPGWGFYMVDLF